MPFTEGGSPERPLREPLLQALQARCEPSGFLPYDRFMEVALYAPGVGYYDRPRSPFGPEGDYYTAPRVHPIFARALANRLAEVRAAVAPGRPFALVDLGCGDGTLLAGILQALGERGIAEGILAFGIDRAESRRQATLRAASSSASRPSPRCARALADLGPVTGLVLAHELLDAQPARRLEWDGQRWRELGFELTGDHVVPATTGLVRPVPPPSLPRLGTEEAGTVLEIAPTAEGLIREVADHLDQGLLLVVDFGAEERELLAAHPRGTVAAVRAHRAVPTPWAAPGEVDLSTFVNFTRIRDAARRAGLVEVAYRSQADALAAWGISAELEREVENLATSEEKVRARLAAKNLLFGFGTYRVLELAPTAPAAGGHGPTRGAWSAGPR